MKSASFNFKIEKLSSIGILWALFVLVAFFIHCPEAWFSFHFSAPTTPFELSKAFSAWIDMGTLMVTCFWLLSLMVWTGKKCLRSLGGVELGKPLTLCVEAALGIFIWDLYWVGTGLTGLWFEPLWWGAAIVLTLAAVPDLLLAVKGLRTLSKPEWPVWFWGLLILYGGAGLWNALLPETFYDSLNYFLGMPQFWVLRHGIVDNPLQLLSGYFYGGSMYFMNGWLFAQSEGATVFSLAAWALCGVMVYGWVEELSNRKAALIAAAATLTLPLLYLNAWAARVDGLFAFVSLLFVYALTRVLQTSIGDRRQWIILAALFAGLAVAIKPTALVVLAAAFLVLLLRREKGLMDRWVPLLVWSFLLGLVSVGPWLLKNWVFAGNAFFPYAYSCVGGRTLWAHGYARLLKENERFLAMDQGFKSILTLPWRLVMPGEGDSQIIGPLTLAFLPSLFLFKLKGTQKFLFWLTLVCFALGFTLSHMLRFSMPAFLLSLVLISALWMAEGRASQFQWSWKASVWILALFFLGAYAVISAQYYQGWERWTGGESREAYLQRMIPNSYEPLVLWTDENLPANARLLIVGDARGLYYRRDFLANSVFDEPFLVKAARQEKDAAGLLRRLKEAGIDDVVINGPEGLRLSSDYDQYDMTPDEWAKINDLVERGLHPVYWKNFQAVYAVKDRLTDERGQKPLNLFSFLSPQAYDFFQAVQAGNKVKAYQALTSLKTLFPAEAYWREQLQAH